MALANRWLPAGQASEVGKACAFCEAPIKAGQHVSYVGLSPAHQNPNDCKFNDKETIMSDGIRDLGGDREPSAFSSTSTPAPTKGAGNRKPQPSAKAKGRNRISKSALAVNVAVAQTYLSNTLDSLYKLQKELDELKAKLS